MGFVSSLILDYIFFEAVFAYITKYMYSGYFIYSGLLFNDWDMKSGNESNFPIPPSFLRFTGPSPRDLSFTAQILSGILHRIISAMMQHE
jgi:hypothetical protein